LGTLQFFDPFYSESKATRETGEIWYVPCPEVQHAPTILDVGRSSPTEHHHVSFEICPISPEQHFRESAKNLPIKLLNLKANEELIVSKGKLRPCVVLAQLPTVNPEELPDGIQRKQAGHLGNGAYLVAPMYSIAGPNSTGTYMSALVERVRKLSYLHLFCLPEVKNPEFPRSIVRLDRVFVSHLGCGCKPSKDKVMINDSPMNMIRTQLSIIYDLPISEEDLSAFEEIKAVIQDS